MNSPPEPPVHIRDEIRFTRPPPRAARALAVAPGAVLALMMILIVLAWLVGRFTSDRYGWSQWLLWIPTPVALLACAMNVLLSFRATFRPRDGRLRAFLWTLATVAVGVYFGLIEHHMFRRSPTIPDSHENLRIVHWNMSAESWTDMPNCIAAMTRLNGDITFLTNPSGTAGHPLTHSWLGTDQSQPSIGTLGVLTRLPIICFRPLLASDGMLVVLTEIDTTATLGRPLTVYLVDMPSKLSIPRMELARKFRALLDGAKPPPPDLVVGDFNLTRDSASLRTMFPSLRHAYHEAGHGYAATFHDEFPLWHIDQMLVGPNIRALDYHLRNTGYGRHRAQVVILAPSK